VNDILLHIDPTPRPVAFYAELWDRDAKTLNSWCVKGWIPGAYKHGNGEWWVKPLALIDWNPDMIPVAAAKPVPSKSSHNFRPARLVYADNVK
jgi:hypothetical protein